MRIRFSRLLSILLIITMGLTLVIPFKLKESYSLEIKQNHAASSPIEDFEIEGNGVLTDYYGDGGDVIIPDGVTSIGDHAFEYCNNITSVTIPSSVKSIGEGAFFDCYSLMSVNMTNGITEIGCGAFYNCSNLTNISLPSSVTLIGGLAFQGCRKLESIIIPDGVTKIDAFTFYGCSSLSSVTIPNGVESIGNNCFSGCEKLVDIVIPTSVTEIGYRAFEHCYSLESIIIPDGVTSIGEFTFNKCSSLKHAFIPSSVATIGRGAFMDCESLVCVTIPNGTTTIERQAFQGCTNLERTYISSGVTSIDASAFDFSSESKKRLSLFKYDYMRIYGDNRWKTAQIIADANGEILRNKGKYEQFIVVNGNKFADALSASYLSYIADAPILLINDANASSVINYIKNHESSYGCAIYVVGGTSAISDAVFEKLWNVTYGRTYRLAGNNACRTNAAVLEYTNSWGGIETPNFAIVCTVDNYADALSAAAIGAPIILVKESNGDLYAAQKEYVKGKKFEKIYVFGGTSAVSDSMAKKIAALTTSKTYERIAGKNRYETSAIVAEKFFGEWTENVVVAYGDNFADALSGGLLAKSLSAPLLLAKDGKTNYATNYVKAIPTIRRVSVLGGPTLVTDTNVNAIMGTSAVPVVNY